MTKPTVRRVAVGGAKGCPVLDGYDPLDQDTVDDPSEWMATARSEAPVFYVPDHDEWVVTRYADCERILMDPKTFSSKDTIAIQPPPPEVAGDLPNGFALQTNVGNMDPPEHVRLRQIIQPAFARKQALLKADQIRALTNRTLDGFIDRGRADLLLEYCQPIPVRVMSSILGIPEAEAPQFYAWAVELVQLFGNPMIEHNEYVRLARGQIEFEKRVRTLIDERRKNPGDDNDFITNLLNAKSEGGEPRLSEREIVGTVTGAIFAGSDTSASALGLILHGLLEDRRLWEELLEDRELVEVAIEEGLRVRNPARAPRRTAMRDVEIGGVVIPKGSAVRVHLWSADHDESVFPNPERFAPHRPNAREHITFGRGPHFCPGANLARVEIRAGVETLLDRLPSLRLVAGHKLRAAPNKIVPALIDGLVVEWDERG
jgi:cytochrome P450